MVDHVAASRMRQYLAASRAMRRAYLNTGLRSENLVRLVLIMRPDLTEADLHEVLVTEEEAMYA
ncbi:hypothetical protein LCGC14_1799700 [marine sediment metagenome]|uniref:Uncharacterized protein n=1 Tax=marine sediment metagenome TaxID=412755 RepID=A0A0F9HCR1_9ZZZZ